MRKIKENRFKTSLNFMMNALDKIRWQESFRIIENHADQFKPFGPNEVRYPVLTYNPFKYGFVPIMVNIAANGPDRLEIYQYQYGESQGEDDLIRPLTFIKRTAVLSSDQFLLSPAPAGNECGGSRWNKQIIWIHEKPAGDARLEFIHNDYYGHAFDTRAKRFPYDGCNDNCLFTSYERLNIITAEPLQDTKYPPEGQVYHIADAEENGHTVRYMFPFHTSVLREEKQDIDSESTALRNGFVPIFGNIHEEHKQFAHLRCFRAPPAEWNGKPADCISDLYVPRVAILPRIHWYIPGDEEDFAENWILRHREGNPPHRIKEGGNVFTLLEGNKRSESFYDSNFCCLFVHEDALTWAVENHHRFRADIAGRFDESEWKQHLPTLTSVPHRRPYSIDNDMMEAAPDRRRFDRPPEGAYDPFAPSIQSHIFWSQ